MNIRRTSLVLLLIAQAWFAQAHSYGAIGSMLGNSNLTIQPQPITVQLPVPTLKPVFEPKPAPTIFYPEVRQAEPAAR